jgi:hypothetical protein
MAEDKNHRDLMRYDLMAQDALRGVVKQALKRAASAQGIPGEHHFYISFQTQAPGVSVPEELVERYPDEMTIVLQHEFWELAPGETFFTVVLRFGGQPKKLAVPYAAVTRFHDPSVPFALQFEPMDIEATEPAVNAEPEVLHPKAKSSTVDTEDAPPDDVPPKDDGPKIVSLDQFRKK